MTKRTHRSLDRRELPSYSIAEAAHYLSPCHKPLCDIGRGVKITILH